MRGSHFAIQLFPAFPFYIVHFKMRAKVCSLKVQAERISKSVHSKGAHFFFWWCISKCGPLPNGLLATISRTKNGIFYCVSMGVALINKRPTPSYLLLDERYDYPVTSNSVDVFSLSHVSECLSSLSETRDVRHGIIDAGIPSSSLSTRVIHWHHHLEICLLM